MPANIESMFSVRQMPWHREGTILPGYPGDWAQARKLAGLNWDPVTTGVYAFTGINIDATTHYEPIDGWKCIIRSDTGAVLSINRDTYTVGGRELSLQFGDSPDSFRALARWAERFGGTVTGQPHTRADGRQTVHCEVKFTDHGVNVQLYAYITVQADQAT